MPKPQFRGFRTACAFQALLDRLDQRMAQAIGQRSAVKCPHYTAGGAFHHYLDVLRADIDVARRPASYLLKSAHGSSSQRIDRRMSMDSFFLFPPDGVLNMFSSWPESITRIGQLLFKTLLMGWRYDKAAETQTAPAGC
ncbi:hypothetical protein ACCS52_26625 [Rhizobium ruizarguesonis]